MTQSSKPFQFESALKELEEITQWFENPQSDLDQSLVKFERGLEHTRALKQHLESVENRVEKIKQRFTNTSSTPSAEQPVEPTDGTELGESIDQTGLF